MRTTSVLITVAFAAAVSAAAWAQTSTPPGNPIATALRQSWDGAKKNLKESAEVMPEANYNFKPIDTVRSFGEIIAHVAGANYVFCAAAKAEKSPHAEDEFEKSAKTRAAIIKALDASLAYCDSSFNSMTDQQLAVTIEMPFGQGKGSRAAALMGNVGHLNEHYGNLVTYFRIKGIVPPSSRR
jgi:uncharacterized damage-inducible protein DinB